MNQTVNATIEAAFQPKQKIASPSWDLEVCGGNTKKKDSTDSAKYGYMAG